MTPAASPIADVDAAPSFGSVVRRAVIWRSGSQIVAQLVQWTSTFLVIRILDPRDYGLFAMCQVVLSFLAMLNGYGLASGFIQARDVGERAVRQLFGLLILLNVSLAAIQWLSAPLIAAYYCEPMVGELLRVQALLYLAIPFIVLPQAVLSRAMDFRHQARANIVASTASAATALTGALIGWGVWTLVAAPAALYLVRAAMMTWSAGTLVRPCFDFRGAGWMARFGGVMVAGQLFWFAQSQADVFIAGRMFPAHELGLYTTALFLAQIFVAKVVPPLNEVAFSAYARLRDDPAATADAFARAARMVMVAGMPFYAGLAVTAEPLVATMLGPKWAGVAPIAQLLAIAMPFMTLHVLLSPACDARGRPGIGVGNGAVGAAILVAAFLVGVRWGPVGLATAWIAAYPLYLGIGAWRALPVIGVSPRALIVAVAPPVIAAGAMAAVVALLARALPTSWSAPVTLVTLSSVGAVFYAGWMWVFARDVVADVYAFARGRTVQAD